MQCFVFLGIQGSGKGTQAELLSERINFQHINIGDLLREQVMKRTELGLKVQDIIGRGDLVSDDLVFEIVESSLNPERKGIVFDGFLQEEFVLPVVQIIIYGLINLKKIISAMFAEQN